MGQACAGGDEGVLDLNGDGLGIVGASVVHHNLDGHGSKALLHGGDGAVFINGHDVFVAGSKFHLGVIGEESIQVIVQPDALRGVHGQLEVTLKETGIAGITQLLILAVDDVIGLQCLKAIEPEDIRNRLVIAAVAFVLFAQNSYGEGDGIVGGRVADLDHSLAGGGGHDLIVDHTGNAGTAGGELQQLTPLGFRVNQRCQVVHFVRRQGQAVFNHGLDAGLLFLGSFFRCGFGNGFFHGFCHGLGCSFFRCSLANCLLGNDLGDLRGFLSRFFLQQFRKIEVGEAVRQADLIGGVVQRIVIQSQAEAVAVEGIGLDLVDVVRQFKGDIGGGVALGVDGGHVLLKALHGSHFVALFVSTHGDIAQLGRHGMVIVKDGSLGIEAVLVHGVIKLVIELHIRQGGCLKVHGQGEFEDSVLVDSHTAIAVVQIALELDGVLGVVGQVKLHGVELDLHIGGVDGAAVAIGLADIGVHSLEDHFAGGIVGDGDLNTLGIAQQTCPDEAQGMDGALLVGQGDVIPVCGDDHILGVLQEVVGAQVADIVLRHAADGAGCVCIGHGLVLHGDGIIQLVSVGGVVIQIEQGCLVPVAVEGQVRNAQVDVGTLGGSQSDEALHIHAVFKGSVQVSLICFTQGNGHGHIGFAACIHSQLGAAELAALHGSDFHRSALQNMGHFGDGGLTGAGLGVADTLGHDVSTDVVGQALVAEIADGEIHGVHAGLIGVVPQLQLGLVHVLATFVLGDDIGGGVDGIQQIGKACTLLADCVGQAVGIDDDISGGHHQPVGHGVDSHIIICNVREVLHNILAHQQHHAGHIGAGHGGAGQAVIAAAGDGGQDVAAVGRDLRLDLQAGRGAPGGEVGNEGAGGLILADLQLAGTQGSQRFAVVLRDGTGGQLGIAHVHLDFTGYIIINDDADGPLGFGDQSLLLEGIVAAANQGDLAVHIQAGIVGASAHARDQHKFHISRILVAQQVLHEVVLLAGSGVGLVEVDDGVFMQQIGGLHTVDGSDGHNAVVGAGRTNRAGIGVGGQAQVAVLLGAVGRGVAVGGSHDHADACVADLLVNAVGQLFLTFPGEAAGGAQRHVDGIHTQDHAVLQRIQNPGGTGGIHDVGEDLHGHQLGIGGNAGDGIVLADNHTGNVGAVVVVGGVGIRVVVGIVIAEGDLLVDVHIIGTEAAGKLVSLGLLDDLSHIVIGQRQLVRSEVGRREGGMIGIQAGIQNGNHCAGTVVAGITALENTGLINVDGIFHQLGLGNPVLLTDERAFTRSQRHAGNGIVPGLDHKLKAGQQRSVVSAGFVGDALLVQCLQDPCLAFGDGCFNGGSLSAVCKVSEGHGLVGAFVGIHQVRRVHSNDDRNLLIIADVFRERKHDGAVQVLFQIHCRGILHLLDVGCFHGRGLGCRGSNGADQKHRSEQNHQHSPHHIGACNLLHVYSRLSFVL